MLFIYSKILGSQELSTRPSGSVALPIDQDVSVGHQWLLGGAQVTAPRWLNRRLGHLLEFALGFLTLRSRLGCTSGGGEASSNRLPHLCFSGWSFLSGINHTHEQKTEAPKA